MRGVRGGFSRIWTKGRSVVRQGGVAFPKKSQRQSALCFLVPRLSARREDMTIIDQMLAGADKPRILGVNRRHFPAQASVIGKPAMEVPPELDGDGMNDQSDDPPPTLCVLVQGDIGDYAAYVGHGTPEWVARFGDKISFEEACCHFPGGQLKKELYRER
jgi:hypothetical protein